MEVQCWKCHFDISRFNHLQFIIEAEPENMVYEKLMRLYQFYKQVTENPPLFWILKVNVTDYYRIKPIVIHDEFWESFDRVSERSHLRTPLKIPAEIEGILVQMPWKTLRSQGKNAKKSRNELWEQIEKNPWKSWKKLLEKTPTNFWKLRKNSLKEWR